MSDQTPPPARPRTPEPQQAHVRILHARERAGLTPVFGSAVPPSGLSGALRVRAFRHGEADWRHWALLMLADRVQVVEGVFDDVSRGRIPNVGAEMGWGSAWRYDRGRLLVKVLAASALVALAVYGLRRRAVTDAISGDCRRTWGTGPDARDRAGGGT